MIDSSRSMNTAPFQSESTEEGVEFVVAISDNFSIPTIVGLFDCNGGARAKHESGHAFLLQKEGHGRDDYSDVHIDSEIFWLSKAVFLMGRSVLAFIKEVFG